MLADAVPSADESAVQTEPTADSSTNISVSAQESNINNAAEVGGDVRQDNIDGRTFRILDTSSGKVVTVSDRDFCYGALAYEMPPSYEKEALKAFRLWKGDRSWLAIRISAIGGSGSGNIRTRHCRERISRRIYPVISIISVTRC